MTTRSANVLSLAFSTLAILLNLATFGCVPPRPTPPPPAPLLRLDVGVYDTKGAIVGAHVEVIDGDNLGIAGTTGAQGNIILTGLKAGDFSVCASAKHYIRNCVGVQLRQDSNTQIHLLAIPPPTPPSSVRLLRPRGRIFYTDQGTPWRWKGVSAFKLLHRYAAGENIEPFLDAYKGFNVLRVWPYVEGPAWKGQDWPVTPSVEKTREFLAYVAARGWYVELTLLTDEKPARVAWAQSFVPQLVAGGCPVNLFLEGENEPLTNGKKAAVNALKSVLQASGCNYTSGIYEDSTKFWGVYLTHHSPRDSEWARKSHDCYEFNHGGGPHKPTDPKHDVPCALDEPAKPADVHMTVDDAKAYGGGAGIMAVGATWHCETCKTAELPTAAERTLAAAMLEGLNAFPEDASLLRYARPVEKSLRTYTAGDRYMVRVRPTTPSPGAGWTAISPPVLWRR